MKNTDLGKIVKNYLSLKLYILNAVSETMLETDKDCCKIDFNNSNLSLKFTDFELTIDYWYSLKIINTNRFFYETDFNKFKLLNDKILSYNAMAKQS